jgi:hypothetical protein
MDCVEFLLLIPMLKGFFNYLMGSSFPMVSGLGLWLALFRMH